MQDMTYREREDLKKTAFVLQQSGDIETLRAIVLMITHWMRQRAGITFSDYAAHWSAAGNAEPISQIANTSMREIFPLREPCKLEHRKTDWPND